MLIIRGDTHCVMSEVFKGFTGEAFEDVVVGSGCLSQNVCWNDEVVDLIEIGGGVGIKFVDSLLLAPIADELFVVWWWGLLLLGSCFPFIRVPEAARVWCAHFIGKCRALAKFELGVG